MSTFGQPGGGQKVSKPTPPERGSFPLDHDGECKSVMLSYLQCIRSHRGTNDPECRNRAKAYLSCRMEQYVPSLVFLIPLRHPLSSMSHKPSPILVRGDLIL
ncbi:uncharacterized protein EI97DRAFT_377492 [Westerdykella ornata]|uniref:CHCH domain-containing protein n=1 Tax=Westerdykella ornata TaxID=318751 RepID=A0A6A6JKA4_WESOR|nr:uncharacterized protein EI97DRAFT_377492 [Westerdykella ornata]KAF2276126.1 hypothetical protein EI97DRAFT_377492 [Westerdykella ornata]